VSGYSGTDADAGRLRFVAAIGCYTPALGKIPAIARQERRKATVAKNDDNTAAALTMAPREETYRLASVMRRVIEQLARADASGDGLRHATQVLEGLANDLAHLPRKVGLEGYAEAATSGDIHALFDHSPLIGLANPLAPPIRLRNENQRVFGSVTFNSAYEGPPGCVHGGFVAAAFDEVLGYCQSLTGSPGMTGTLTIRYKAPTPLNVELAFEAWVERVEGRKIFARGTLNAGTLRTAEAEGLFVSVDAGRFAALMADVKRLRDGNGA